MPVIGVKKAERVFMSIPNYLFWLLFPLIFISCREDDNAINLVDQLGVVNLNIDLNDPENQVLRQNGGFKYFPGGRRGILVVNKNINQYSAFERSCTFQFNSECATVSIHSSLTFILDSCCSSQFDLNGQVIQPPATDPLIQYSTFLIGNELRIQYP